METLQEMAPMFCLQSPLRSQPQENHEEEKTPKGEEDLVPLSSSSLETTKVLDITKRHLSNDFSKEQEEEADVYAGLVAQEASLVHQQLRGIVLIYADSVTH